MKTVSIADALKMGWQSKKSKYNNVKTEYNGRKYDSMKEANYSATLDQCKKAKSKKDRVIAIEYQVPYILQPAFKDKKGVTIRAIKYYSDFVVTYADKHISVIDVKTPGTTTNVYKIKKKMLKYMHDIDIIEV